MNMAGLEVQLPGETEERSAIRAIKMHEFLMTGGVKIGEREGRTTYSDPIIHTDPANAVCPWHGTGCTAWGEIVAGRGYWTRLVDELAEARAEAENLAVGSGEHDEALDALIEKLADKLAMQPRDARALRERTPEMLAEERAHAARNKAKRRAELDATLKNAKKVAEAFSVAPNWRLQDESGWKVYCESHRPKPVEGENWSRVPKGRSQCIECEFEKAEPKMPVYAKAGPKTGGNPWDKPSTPSKAPRAVVNTSTGEVTGSDDWWNEPSDGTVPARYTPPTPDARDEAIDAFAGAEMPDTIEIDGDEEDEEGE